MDEELKRKIQIGFMDSLSLETRRDLINKGVSAIEASLLGENYKSYQKDAEDVLDWMNRDPSNTVCWYGDEDFPTFTPVERKLPYMLFCKGKMLKKDSPSLAIVGTRHVDNEGFQASFKIGLEASVNGISVVSGLADGCDQASLYGAVVGKYPSYGILGCGLEIKYPSFSDSLKQQMIECGGAIISRFPPFYPPLKQNFPNRNLIIAAMGCSTIVVQAPKKSGSLITSDMTMQLGKEVLVSRAGKGNSWARVGSNQLLTDGALIFDSISEVYECKFKVELSNSSSDIRFGNRHYFIRKLN